MTAKQKQDDVSEVVHIRVTIVGCGGIGSNLAELVARRLAYHRDPAGRAVKATLTLVDGDTFEDRNAERQSFEVPGGKAESLQARLLRQFPPSRIDIAPFSEYLGPETAPFILTDGEIVLVCVDNHPTRKFICDHVREQCAQGDLRDISVISGGNDTGGKGDVFCYYVRNGRDVTPPLDQLDDAIAHPKEKAPWEKSCEELAAAGEPQLLAANATAALVMLNVLHELLADPEGFVARAGGSERGNVVDTGYNVVSFDVRHNVVQSFRIDIAGRDADTEGDQPQAEAAAGKEKAA